MGYIIKNIRTNLYYQKIDFKKEPFFAEKNPFKFKYKNDAKELISILKDNNLQIIKQ